MSNQLSSIQPESLIYFPTNTKSVKELESRLENKLRDKIEQWRSRYITPWNRTTSTALRQILTKMEKNREVIKTEPEELEQTLRSFKMCGFPLNMPYTDTNTIIDAVFSTQIHAVPTSDVEFALAVHIHAYPNTILSVWVYVANLMKKD